MKFFILILIFLSILIISCGENIPHRERKEICYRVLDIEKEAGFKVAEEDYELLDKILYEIEKEIVIKKSYTEGEAKEILRQIGFIIRRNGISIEETNFYCFHSALFYKKFLCYDLSLVYITASERLNLPLRGLFLEGFSIPGKSSDNHVLIIWEDSTKEILWETTNNSSVNTQYLKEKNRVDLSDSSDFNKFYKTCDNKAFFFSAYRHIFHYFLENQQYNNCKKYYNYLIQNLPNSKLFFYRLHQCKFLLNNMNEIKKIKILNKNIYGYTNADEKQNNDTVGIDAIPILHDTIHFKKIKIN